ncbi:hypothetical protein A2Z67_06480 [Candidatus Woesebacteria bacterium RBG_13_36_22]|uniref:NAD-dependent epimerase/dehydratase domain-containing protein n=2 Tax=Candidatus Woeseibacteriota TaxID=1752722 RepID=A0A1F7X1U7_9BACT|nr:MAG: hypothetical protein A2Z67_06480 [Candidatus Woesebacteria bacterium RBG_13_36_22]
MKTVLVTGGAGFLGSHLCDRLIEKKYRVICLDNLITGSERNIKHLLKNNNFKFIKADVTGDLDLNLKLDYIFHLASPASPIDYQNHPEETALANSLGTLKMLRLAVKNKARFLLASTSEIYGDPKEHPQKESYWGNVNSYGPRSCYDESKRFAEALVYLFIHKYNLDVRIIRIFNTYGPRMQKDDGRAVSSFINQALDGKPLTIYGRGNQTRSFCYYSDLINGIEKVMFEEGLKGEIFNLGNPNESKIIELAKLIISLTNSKSEIQYLPLPKDDPARRRPDITKAKKLLSWEPIVDISEGLKKTIEYYRNEK